MRDVPDVDKPALVAAHAFIFGIPVKLDDNFYIISLRRVHERPYARYHFIVGIIEYLHGYRQTKHVQTHVFGDPGNILRFLSGRQPLFSHHHVGAGKSIISKRSSLRWRLISDANCDIRSQIPEPRHALAKHPPLEINGP